MNERGAREALLSFVTAAVEETGKNVQQDSSEVTAVDLYGVEGAKGRAREFQETAIEHLDGFGDDARYLRCLVREASWTFS